MYPKWVSRGDRGSAYIDSGTRAVTNGDGGQNGIIPVKDD